MENKEIWWHTALILQHYRQVDKGLHPPFFKEGWPWNSQELPRYKPYFHCSQDLQCSETHLHRTWKWLTKKTIHDITIFDNITNIGRCLCKKPCGDTIICRLLQGIWLHTQREDVTNTSCLWSSQRNRCSHNEGVCGKNLAVTLLFVDFSEAFDSIHRGKMQQILLTYGLPKETAIVTLYKNTKVKFRSLDGDTDFFDIVTDVPQGETLAPYFKCR